MITADRLQQSYIAQAFFQFLLIISPKEFGYDNRAALADLLALPSLTGYLMRSAYLMRFYCMCKLGSQENIFLIWWMVDVDNDLPQSI